jgi:hypothetical protein
MPLPVVTDPNHLPKNALLAAVDFPYLTELEEVTDNLPVTIVPSEEVIVVHLLSQKIDSLSYLFFFFITAPSPHRRPPTNRCYEWILSSF